ncbi:MAG: dihydroorotate dehydrogenase electron transfer subunit [Pirellulales bacterium]|nr:dihydroorotate dehydrogenase electron transfer subunit [Pirellulales bacterium]
MLRLSGGDDPLLGRPLALYDVVFSPLPLGEGQGVRATGIQNSPHPSPLRAPTEGWSGEGTDAWGLDIVYLVVGKMTGRLAKVLPGTVLEAWGPLGNGFPPEPTEHLLMVAGGIGQTPFPALAREYLGKRRYGQPPREVAPAKKVTLCYGARTAEYLAGVDDFRRIGVDVRISTDDGSAGHRGLVTELIEPMVAESGLNCRIVCCGPEPMLQATAKIAARLKIPCQVSLETPMACGIGACFSCVAKIRDGHGGWDYRRTCIEGPVFNAADVEFE